jgi:hypothetical protein
LRKTPIFCRKLGKIAENCDHNIDPGRGEFPPLERFFFFSSFLKISEFAKSWGYFYPKMSWATFWAIFPQTHRHIWSALPGVNVKSKNFGEFCQFSGKNCVF